MLNRHLSKENDLDIQTVFNHTGHRRCLLRVASEPASYYLFYDLSAERAEHAVEMKSRSVISLSVIHIIMI